MTAPRLAPIPVEQWGEVERAALEVAFPRAAPRILSTGPDALPASNAVCTMMHHPTLAGPFLAYSAVLLEKPALGHRNRELITLRIAARTGSEYEWAQHVRLAELAGMTTAEIDAVRGGTGSWTPLETDLLAATDQLVDSFRIDDDTWARLTQHLDEKQLVEVVFVAGTYMCLAMAFNSLGIEIDPDLQQE
jgi:alkylhydroperoxidase family enzyme